MSNFDSNGNYNKTNWKDDDLITADKLNKIEDAIQTVNNNDIERYKEADERLDALEEQKEAVEEELNNKANKDEVEQFERDMTQAFGEFLEEVNEQLEHTEKQISNYINVGMFDVKGDGKTDDTVNLQKAIDYAKSHNIYNIQFPNGVFKTTSTLYLPPGIEISSSGKAKNSTVILYEGVTGFAIATKDGFGEHRRNKINGIGIVVKSLTASGGILIGSESDDTIIPVQHILDNIEIQDLSVGQIGIWLKNASGINMTQVLCNRGTGGTGLLVTANGNNTGVMNFNNCSFGGYNQNDVGVELRHGTGGLDGFCFNGCYFGGKKPFMISGSSIVKNISINAAHVEVTSDVDEYCAFDINSVVGLTINSITLCGKRDTNFVGFLFKGICKNIVIQGVDCNEFNNGTLYKYIGDTPSNFNNALLFEGSPTGTERNIIQTSGDFSNITLISNNGKLTSNNLVTNRLDSTDVVSCSRMKATSTIILGSNNSQIQYTSTEPTSNIARGNFYLNQKPVELGEIGSKYVIIGWIGIGADNVKECRCLTGN